MKWITCALVLLWAGIGCGKLYNRIYQEGERDGYERGAYQGAIFAMCEGSFPTKPYKDEFWNLVNMPKDCRFVEAALNLRP